MRLLITIISIVIPILTFAQSTIRLAFTGDIMMGTAFPDSSYLPPNNGANLFEEVSHIIKNVNCAFGNLEGVLLDKDILSNGEKIYSPETCCFVPIEIKLTTYLFLYIYDHSV